jgi:hypothetical protein
MTSFMPMEGRKDPVGPGSNHQVSDIIDKLRTRHAQAGYDAVQTFIPNRGIKVGSAVFTSDRAGNYGEDWLLRSAMVLAGAMYPTVEVSRYADIFSDAEGNALTGKRVYTMTFRPGELPPVTRFWSLTIYSLGSYDIVANPIDRYKIGPEMPGLQRSADGSLTITLVHEKPQAPESAANWLPTPSMQWCGFMPLRSLY